MIYSNACAHAIRALVRLTALYPGQRVLMKRLCADSDLPRHFVAKVFQQLVHAGIVVSHKGRGGGFALARQPEEISLLHIVRAIDGLEAINTCIFSTGPCNPHRPCPMRSDWEPVRNQILKYLGDTTLRKLADSDEYHWPARPQPLANAHPAAASA